MIDLAPLQWQFAGLPAALRWQINHRLLPRWHWFHWAPARLTIYDAFGGAGDTLLTAIVCRHVRQRFPQVRLNCLTPNPDLLLLDPHIDTLNAPEDYLCVWHWYLDLIERKDPHENVLAGTFRQLGIADYEYKARVYLSAEERRAGRQRLEFSKRPVITFNTLSKEPVKNWLSERWHELVGRLRADFDLVQLGDDAEPEFAGVRRFAGQLNRRESMAVLASASLHLGPDSFLTHAANGLDVPAVVLYGGSRTPANSGYAANLNLFRAMPCGPCQIHASRGEVCAFDIACMRDITTDEVCAAVQELSRRGRPT